MCAEDSKYEEGAAKFVHSVRILSTVKVETYGRVYAMQDCNLEQAISPRDPAAPLRQRQISGQHIYLQRNEVRLHEEKCSTR